MKLIILISMMIFTVNSMSIIEHDENNTDVNPANICANQPSGTTFPVLNDCSQFIVCIGSNMIHSKCPTSTPYFDPCTSMCSAYSFVCYREYCYEPTTLPPTAPPTAFPTVPQRDFT